MSARNSLIPTQDEDLTYTGLETIFVFNSKLTVKKDNQPVVAHQPKKEVMYSPRGLKTSPFLPNQSHYVKKNFQLFNFIPITIQQVALFKQIVSNRASSTTLHQHIVVCQRRRDTRNVRKNDKTRTCPSLPHHEYLYAKQ